jgi:hypothetical protein
LRDIERGRFALPPAIKSRLGEIISKWLYQMDGMAHARVGEAILNSLAERSETDKSVCRSFFYGSDLPASFWSRARVSQYAKRLMGLPPNWSFRRLGEYMTWLPPGGKSFTCQQVQQYVARIQGVMSQRGAAFRPVKVALARERGDYFGRYQGYSVAMSAD